MKKYIPYAFMIAFLLIGYNAYIESKPTDKAPIYKEIKKYSPYYLEKRFGGLEIRSKIDKDFKEKPSNMEVFHRLELLEKSWGKKYLKIESNILNIKNDFNKTIKSIAIKTESDRVFLQKYYGIK